MASRGQMRRGVRERARESERLEETGLGVVSATRRVFDVRDDLGREVILLARDLRLANAAPAVRCRVAESVYDALEDLADRVHHLAEMVISARGKPYPEE